MADIGATEQKQETESGSNEYVPNENIDNTNYMNLHPLTQVLTEVFVMVYFVYRSSLICFTLFFCLRLLNFHIISLSMVLNMMNLLYLSYFSTLLLDTIKRKLNNKSINWYGYSFLLLLSLFYIVIRYFYIPQELKTINE